MKGARQGRLHTAQSHYLDSRMGRCMEAEHRGVVARGWGNGECLLMGWFEVVRTLWNSMVAMVIQLRETLTPLNCVL